MNLEKTRNRFLLAREKYIKEELMYEKVTEETNKEFQEASSDLKKIEKQLEEHEDNT